MSDPGFTSVDRSPLSTHVASDQPGREISALPFMACGLYSTVGSYFLHFYPGTFCRGGTLIGAGATFVVEKHSLQHRFGTSMVDPFTTAEVAWCSDIVAVKKVGRISKDARRVFQTLERELVALDTLRFEKNVIQLLGVGWEPSPTLADTRLWPVLVVEYAEHVTLADLQRQKGALHYTTKRKICLDIANGLQAVHKAGLVHGDLKSENVLIFEDDEEGYVAKLSDFGLSSSITHLRTERMSNCNPPTDDTTFSPLGATEIWAAPEYRECGTRAALASRDVYSLGLLMARVMLDDKYPLAFIDSLAQLEDEQRSLNSDGPGTSPQAGASWPGSSKITLDRHVDPTDWRIRMQAVEDALPRVPSYLAPTEEKNEASAVAYQKRRQTFEELKRAGKDKMIRFAISCIDRNAQADVKGVSKILVRALACCWDADPRRRSPLKFLEVLG